MKIDTDLLRDTNTHIFKTRLMMKNEIAFCWIVILFDEYRQHYDMGDKQK